MEEGEISSENEEGRLRCCGNIVNKTSIRDQKGISRSDGESAVSLLAFNHKEISLEILWEDVISVREKDNTDRQEDKLKE